MEQLDYIKLKKSLNSRSVINQIEDDWYKGILATSINFLVSTKKYNDLGNYLKSDNSNFLPFAYLKDKYNMNNEEVFAFIYDNFIRNGYLYHVTKSTNVDSILESGILSLNDKFNTNLYVESLKVNECFENFIKRNYDAMPLRSNLNEPLIKVPNCREKLGINNSRFSSIYVTLNISNALSLYGDNGELMELFVVDLLKRFCKFHTNSEFKRLNKDKIRSEIVSAFQDKKYDIEDKELDTILSFYDKYYDDRKGTESLIMIPINNVLDYDIEGKVFTSSIMKVLEGRVTDPEVSLDFMNYCLGRNDIEINSQIKKEGLIAISYDKRKSKFLVKSNR